MIPDIWDQALSLPILTMLGLVLAGFLPLLYSVWETWMADPEQQAAPVVSREDE